MQFLDKYKDFLLNSKKRFIIIFGGRGSGKSFQTALWMLLLLMKSKEQIKIVASRKTETSSVDSAFSDLEAIIYSLGFDNLFKITSSPAKITYVKNDIDPKKCSQILFKGMKDSKMFKSIANIKHVWIEEADQLTYNDFLDLQFSIRKKGSQLFLVFNPPMQGAEHWIYKEFFDKERDDVEILHTNYLDNPHLPQDYLKSLENLKSSDFYEYERVVLGKWTSDPSRRVLPQFDEEKHTTDDYNFIDRLTQDRRLIVIGQDFNVGAYVSIIMTRFKDFFYIVEEKCSHNLNDVEGLAKGYLKKGCAVVFCPDATRQTSISDVEIIRRWGFKVKLLSNPTGQPIFTNEYVEDGFTILNSLLSQDKILISKKCTQLIKACKMQLYNDKWVMNKSHEHPALDDYIDAFRYAIFRFYENSLTKRHYSYRLF